MKSRDYKISITYFDAGAGDAVWIRFLGDDQQWHHILIDGGYGYAYKLCFGPLLQDVDNQDEAVDLWVVSHIDLDHIGAVLAFTNDRKIKYKASVVKKFWFNHSPMPVQSGNGKLAVEQGIKLRDYLAAQGLLADTSILSGQQPTDIAGLKIRPLSPTKEKLEHANRLWQAEEKTRKLGRNASQSDHGKTIESLKSAAFVPDTDPVNGSSISCLIEYRGLNFLFLADSHPADVAAALRKMGHSEENRINAEMVQVSHHGSKANTSPELLSLITSNRFVITGNGIANVHPDKETLARLLTQKKRNETPLTLIFPYATPQIKKLFSADPDAENIYNFRRVFPETGSSAVSMNYLPLAHPPHE